jgi:hypothetical protein
LCQGSLGINLQIVLASNYEDEHTEQQCYFYFHDNQKVKLMPKE